jgi:AcrR family transcriptional regulator
VSTTAPRMAAADRRQHLVETAIRLFTEGSYHGTTTAEIARTAGVSEPILYRHFASKRDLYLASLEHVWAKTRELWERTLDESTDACAAIEAIGKGHVSVRSPKLQLAELWVQALSEASEDPELRRHLRRHMREVHDFVANLIRRGQTQGAIAAERDADSEAWIMLAGGILGMVGRRVGLLDDKELQAIRTARLAWLRGGKPLEPTPASRPEAKTPRSGA